MLTWCSSQAPNTANRNTRGESSSCLGALRWKQRFYSCLVPLKMNTDLLYNPTNRSGLSPEKSRTIDFNVFGAEL